jgi:glycosyltransferase involved in cell wall biosynthesis
MVTIQEPMMPLPTDLPIEELPQRGPESWGAHWGAMIRYLEENAPCVYIPNSDWRHSNVCAQLSPEVRVVGVVHSDDPLHYDHAARLGRYWDTIVTTSDAIAQQVIARNPPLASRVQTIPIGVPVPASPLPRKPVSGPLKLVYQGRLIQHQKRILDLPKIVEAALGLRIPIELTVIGDGAERERLVVQSTHLADAGAMRFMGVVPHARLMELLGKFDVFLLTSEFEGMPNVLGEAMARGCIPIVTDIRSGIRDLVRDGESGFVVPVGDVAAFADRLSILYRDPELRCTMAAKVREAVIAGGFSVDKMVERYAALFRSLFNPRGDLRFQRPLASLRLPPYQVGQIKIFELRQAHWFENIGVLPSRSWDYEGYRRELNGTRRSVPPFHAKLARPYPNVVLSATSGRVSGVDIFSVNLVRGLRGLGRDAHVLMTSPGDETPDHLPLPKDIPVRSLPVSRRTSWRKRWQRLREHLEGTTPCIYIPNYDWNYSCICPTLSQNIGIVGIVHSDDPAHYEHVTRLGRFWNAIVAVSGAIAHRVVELDPSLSPRVITIPYGVEVPPCLPQRTPANRSVLRIVYAGRLVQEQKRVLDIPKVFGALMDREVPAELTFIGGGQEEHALKMACEPWVRSRQVHFAGTLPNPEVLQLFAESDVLILTSEFEGLPVSLLEAMAQGCVPVVSDISSGIPDVVRQGETGYRVPVGDIVGFAECLAKLQADAALRQTLSSASYQAIREDYSTEGMVAAYMSLFDRVLVEAELGEFRRSGGEILPPPNSPWLSSRYQRWPGGGFLRYALSTLSNRLGRK